MRISHINTSTSGGAATACLRIHQSLLNQGVESKVLVLYKTRDISDIYMIIFLTLKTLCIRYSK